MATSMADLVAKRANPKGETPAEMERRLKMEKARRDAEKRVTPSAGETVEPDDMMERRAAEKAYNAADTTGGLKKGGKVKKYAKGGYVKAADGCAQRGKTRGRMA